MPPGAEPRIRLSFRLKDDQPWATTGHEVAWADFLLPSAMPGPPIDPSGAPAPEVLQDESSIRVSGDGFAVEVDKATGAMTSFASGETELLREPFRPDFWRAMTDNDLGNSLNERAAVWRDLGDELTVTTLATYADRLLLPVGLYDGLVADQFVPYARPQESGNKADARFVALTDVSGNGLLAVGEPLLSVNASPFSTEALELAKHPHEVVSDGHVHLNLDRAQRGVAGDNSWGRAPLPDYIIEPDAQSYRFWMKALRPGDDLVALARRTLP